MLETNPKQVNLMGFAATVALSVLLTFFSYHFLDARLALFAAKLLDDLHLSKMAAEIPGVMFSIALAITVLSWTLFLFLALRSIQGTLRSFFFSLGLTVPLSLLMKISLKYVFGRALPGYWFHHQDSFGFHWFQGGGNYDAFPSGHMAVLTAVMLCLNRCYPRFKNASHGFLLVFGLALVLTNHHFLSDVIAGFLVGVVSEWTTHAIVLQGRAGHELIGTE